MPRGNYTPEIKSSMGTGVKGRVSTTPKKPEPGDTPKDMARDRQRGIPEDSPQDQKIDAQAVQQGIRPGSQMPTNLPNITSGGGGHDPAHAAMAASIAHAILGRGGR